VTTIPEHADPDRATVTETYQGWRVPAIIGADRAVGGREHAAYIKRAETEAEAVEKVREIRRVLEAPSGEVTPIVVDSGGVRVRQAEVGTRPSEPNGVLLLDGETLNQVGAADLRHKRGSVTGRGRLDGDVFDVTVEWDRADDAFTVSGEWPNKGLSAEFDYRRDRTPDCGTGHVFVLDCFPGVDATVEIVPEDHVDVGRVGGDGA